MPRQITEHQNNGCNQELTIVVADEPGAGGASHVYQIFKADPDFDPMKDAECEQDHDFLLANLSFQNGPIQEAGVNGITQEALIAIVLDRLRSFQSGSYACRENAIAITKLEEAQMWLDRRTRARLARGVEGTHKV